MITRCHRILNRAGINSVAQRAINILEMSHGDGVVIDAIAALRAKGVFGVIHNASYGSNFIDPAYTERRKAVAEAGLLWGASHFLDSSNADDQAAFFLESAGVSDINSDPILLSVTYNNSTYQPTLEQLLRFISAVDRASPPGVQTVLHSGNLIRETLRPYNGGFQNPAMVGVEMFFAQHRLWLSENGPKEQIPYPWNLPISETIPAPGVWLWTLPEKAPLPGQAIGCFFNGTFGGLQEHWLR